MSQVVSAVDACVIAPYWSEYRSDQPAHNRQVRTAKLRINLREFTAANPEKVLQSFNTWAFKREQPSDPALILETVARKVEQGQPIPFVLYWGKGPRGGLAEPDVRCLDYLASMAGRIRDAYAPGAALTLIYTDTHAALNGHSAEHVQSYFGAVDGAARERGFESCLLSDLTRWAAVEPDPEEASGAMLASLQVCAAKWFRGEGTSEEGALRYYRMNMLEKRAVEHAFPDAIFVTFNGSNYRNLFPTRMPIFYMYSLQRGFGVKPWFMVDGHLAASA